MLTSYFNPRDHSINRICLGVGDWPINNAPSELDVIKTHLPFNGVTAPRKFVDVKGIFSLDGEVWYPEFPLEEVLDTWKSSSEESISGIISFRIEIYPDETIPIRELGFFVDDKIVIYKIINEVVIGKVDNSHNFCYKFNYNIKCNFASCITINSLIEV